MIVTPPPEGLARPADTDVSDLTSAKRNGPAKWIDETTIEIPFKTEPTEAEQELIVRRLLTRDEAEETQTETMQTILAKVTGTDAVSQAVRLLLQDRLAFLNTDA